MCASCLNAEIASSGKPLMDVRETDIKPLNSAIRLVGISSVIEIRMSDVSAISLTALGALACKESSGVVLSGVGTATPDRTMTTVSTERMKENTKQPFFERSRPLVCQTQQAAFRSVFHTKLELGN